QIAGGLSIRSRTQPIRMPPRPDALEAVRVQRVAQAVEQVIVERGEEAAFQRNAGYAELPSAFEEVPNSHGPARRLLQPRINLAEIAVITVGIDGDLHEAIPDEIDAACWEYNDPCEKGNLSAARKEVRCRSIGSRSA